MSSLPSLSPKVVVVEMLGGLLIGRDFETNKGSLVAPKFAVEARWSKTGPVAQWIRHLTTNQGIPGSSPGRIGSFDQPATKLESHEKAIFSTKNPYENAIQLPGAY